MSLNNRVARAVAEGVRWAFAALLMLGAACAGKDDINRTQPDKVDKAIFFDAGGAPKKFYYRKTTTGVPPTSAYSFEGMMGETMKVRFEIREKYLVGYRSYDYAPGSEDEFNSGGNNDDAPMLVFAVSSHFDVKREYNAATGEQTNVISENTNDRPWNERQFMRVDWSRNLAEGGVDMTAADPMASILTAKTLDVGFSIGEGDEALVHPDRPIITASYIDFTTKELRTPDLEACATMFDTFDDAGPWGCGPAEITYRNSLLPVPASEYEPMAYPDRQVLLDNNGKPIRTILDQASCDQATLNSTAGAYSGADCSVAAVEQFSKFGFFRTVRQNYDRRVGATEQGRDYFINRWNIWQETVAKDGTGKPITNKDGSPARLPYNQRKTKIITYYLNPEFPDDPGLRDSAKQVAADWNDAFKETVAALQYAESNPKNPIIAQPMLTERAKSLPDIVVLKENGCSVANVKAFLNAHADAKKKLEAQVGKATLDLDNIDKTNLLAACSGLSAVTEELPEGDANKFVWQRNGDLRYSFIWWVNRPQVAGPLGYGPASQDPETGEIISASAYLYGASLDTYSQFAADSVQLANGQLSPDELLSGKTISDVLQETKAASAARMAQTITPAAKQNAMSKLRARGATPDKRLVKVGAGVDDQALAKLKGSSLTQLLFNDDVLPGLFPGYKPGDLAPGDPLEAALKKPWMSSQAAEKRRKRFQTLAQNGCVYLAEFADDAILGTALALQQQKLSGDALWQALRSSIFRSIADHEVGHTMGLRHNFAASTDALNYDDRYWQLRSTKPESEWEPNGLSELAYASVMDYGSRFNSDVHGLGKYDKAAIRFGYGQLIDILPDADDAAGSLQFHILTDDYTKIPEHVGGLDKMDTAATMVMPYGEMIKVVRDGYLNVAQNGGQFGVYPERPYKFCGDEFEGNLDCKTWDRGANQREIVNNVTEMYRNYYVFNAYKRGRTTWTIDNYLSRLEERYFNRYQQAFQFFYFYGDAFSDYELSNDLFMASVDALNALGEVLQTPEPGTHCVTPNNPSLLVVPSTRSGPDACTPGKGRNAIGLPDAKPYYIEFSDDYYYRITRAGSLYEKLEALFTLTSTESRFYRVDSFADANRYSINFYQLFRDEVVKLLSGVIRNDPSVYGGTITAAGYQATPVVDLTQWGLVNPPVPDYAKPDAARVDTPANRTIRYWALLLTLARLGSTWDATLDFNNFLVVTVKGSNDDLTLPAGVPIKEFTHPISGVTYRAPVIGAPGNIGADIIDELNLIAGTAGTPGTLPSKFGTLADGSPVPDWQTAKAQVAAAKAAGDQDAYQQAVAVFNALDGILGYRVDLIGDIRSFRKQLYLP